ncbi:hypothetical protein A2U01_0098905, partial [Trifolium medium]|nr:hypothetical protein [Trifolium medium]
MISTSWRFGGSPCLIAAIALLRVRGPGLDIVFQEG